MTGLTADTAVAAWRAVADERGDAVAILTPEGSMTFAQARSRADERAAAIAAAVDEPARPIAVDVESDVESVIATLAVLCSGHPVIFLDPLLPADRRAHILELSGAQHFSPVDIADLPASSVPPTQPDPLDPAVIIFTSGSTGKPKGVVHPQRNWVNQARDGAQFLELGPADREAILLPLSFGAGFDCLIMGLLNGATLLLWDVRRRTTAGLAQWLTDVGATTAHCTPSLLRAWLPEITAAVPTLRLMTTCGEPVHHADVAGVRATLMPDGVFCSWSGSSEMGNLAFNRFPADRDLPDGALPVGTPALDKQVRIVGDDGSDLPAGQAGEIIVESRYLALRYHGDPVQTAARFEVLDDGRTRLRTGDLGRFDETGQLHLLGRHDDALKIRGYLVEPIEVEAALRALRWTVDAVVTADRAASTMTAHVAVDQAGWTPSPAEVRTELAKTLAPWMIPRDIVIVTELPRTERGKVDRAALPPPPARNPEPVRGPTEATLLHIWCDVLQLDVIGRDEDFISLGGDSLAAARMLGEISQRWLVDIATSEFAAEPTIAGLAGLLDAGHNDRARTAATGSITQLRSGTGDPMFIFAGAGSPAASLLPLVHELAGDFPVYGLQAHGLERRGRADRTIATAARRAVRDIRSVAPQGPYRLAGYSFGAFVMLEAATVLAGSGVHPTSVVLIDALFEPELLARVAGAAPAAPTAPERAALPDRSAAQEDSPSEPATWQHRLVTLWNRLAMRGLVATAGLVRLPTTLQWTVFWDLGRVLIKRHRPTPYAGRVKLIMASTNPDDVDTWSRLVTGELTIVRVGGDHHSMMRPPHVAVIAAEVTAALEESAAGESADQDEVTR